MIQDAPGATENAPRDTYTRQQIQERLDAFTAATKALSEAVRNGARPPGLVEPEESEQDGGRGMWSSKPTEEQDR